jgi:hypothetical protein
MSFPAVVALVSTLVVALSAISGAGSVYLIHRRTATGKVGASEASILWQQAQDMRTMLMAEKSKAEEQRDRMIDVQISSALPALKLMGESLESVKSVMQETISMMDKRFSVLDEIQKTLSMLVDRDAR